MFGEKFYQRPRREGQFNGPEPLIALAQAITVISMACAKSKLAVTRSGDTTLSRPAT